MTLTERSLIRLFVMLIVFTSLLFACPRSAGGGQKIRAPGVAGSFYPGDPNELTKMVDGFLSQAGAPAVKGSLIAVVSPHAGYPYSGPVAAYSYALLRGRKYARVVVISPSHYEAFPFSSVYNGDAYSTPLGMVTVDRAFAQKLAARSSTIKFSDQGHREVQGRWEHALEDELPFLQRVLGEFKLVPIVMGDQDYLSSRALGVALAKTIAESARNPDGTYDTLIVASSDLSHYHPYDDAVTIDHKTLSAVEEWDYFNMSLNFERMVWEACGGGGIVAAMIAAERLGANRAQVLKYANSGDTTGDKSRVVGYGAMALTSDPSAQKAKVEFKLDAKEKRALMVIARNSVETAVREGKLYQCSPGGLDSLARDRGAFVTLKEQGQLRGCIGYIAPMKPLCMTVRDVAREAALHDPRFIPVAARELGAVEYEVSVLSPLRRVMDWKNIQVGRDGLLVREGEYEGVLLPQVATEEHWDRNTFLNEVCLKAGLPSACWKNEDTDVFSFTAVVFGGNYSAGSNQPDDSDRLPKDTPGRQPAGPPR